MKFRTLCVSVIAVFALAVVAVGCGSDSDSDKSASTTTSASSKDKPKIALLMSNPFNSAFGKPAVAAMKQIESELGNQVDGRDLIPPADYKTTIENYAQQGYGLIIIHGQEMQAAAQQVAPKYPKVKIAVINGFVAKPPNLSSNTFAWEESGYLAGIAAGYSTKVNKIGVVSSIKIPPIQRLYQGFVQGVKSVNPDATSVNTYTGSTTDTAAAARSTTALASQGIDVFWTLATGGDAGVFSTAEKKGRKVIGYGTDESNLAPSVTITSDLVDYQAVMFDVASQFDKGTLAPKVYESSFKDNVFSLAPIKNVDAETTKKIEAAVADATAGKANIKVTATK